MSESFNVWILNADHAITTWYESTPDTAQYFAKCKCGWHATSASAGLRNWNAEGHANDVRSRAQHVQESA